MKITDKKFILINKEKDFSRIFRSTWTYIKSFLSKLWKNPYIIYQLVINSNVDDVKNNLAPFFVNNFYNNILSSNYFGDNLLYIISLLLKQEINNIKNPNNPETFLEGTPCGFFLEQLCDRNDFKSFCKLNILNIVDNLESKFSSKKICFDIDIIQENFMEKMKEKKNSNSYSMFKRSVNNLFFIDDKDLNLTKSLTNMSLTDDKELIREKKNSENIKLFNSKYLIDLKLKILKEYINKYEEEKNENMKDYIKNQVDESKFEENEISKKENEIFTNRMFINNLFACEHSKELFSIYIISFLKAIESINSLFKNLISNAHLLPYSIKCICKIILILFQKKFPNMNKAQQTAFMSKFFFNKLFLPVLKNPSLGALINEFIISEETINNLTAISEIISKLCSGKFYSNNEKEGSLNPFNRFFLEKMPYVFRFYENILKIDLPNYIIQLINDKLPEDFRPSYFEDYPDEVIAHRSIFFSFDDLYIIIQNMNKIKDKLFINEKTKRLEIVFNKIIQKNNMEELEKIKNEKVYENIDNNNDIKSKGKHNKKNQKDNEIKRKEIEKYFLITKILTNKKYSYIFKMKPEKPYFNLKENKKNETEEEINLNNIIKVKNAICQILYNYCLLKKEEFNKDKLNKSFNIFKELKKYVKSSDFVIDEAIPNEWYVNSLLEYINKIPEKYSNNDYELLYEEINQDINNSIKSLSFEIFGLFLDRIKHAKKNRKFYQNIEKSLIDISLNERVQAIIEYTQIPCEFYFSYNDKRKEINIRELKKEDRSIDFLDSMILKEKNSKTCKTIKSFIKYFPNIVKSNAFFGQNLKIFEMLKKMEIPKIIDKYLNIIKNNLYKLKVWSTEEEFTNINNKIYDFVTEKLYDKIYPSVPCKTDINIYTNSLKLSWVEPKHFMKDKNNYTFDSFLHNVIYDFNQLNKEKSPRKKIIYLRDIFNCINNLIALNGEDESNKGIDDQISILNFSFIKAQPINIETDCNYIELFIDQNGENSSLLAQLRVISKFVENIEYKNLIGVNKDEFETKFVLKEDFTDINIF